MARILRNHWWEKTEARRELRDAIDLLDSSLMLEQPLRERLLDVVQSAASVLDDEVDHRDYNTTEEK